MLPIKQRKGTLKEKIILEFQANRVAYCTKEIGQKEILSLKQLSCIQFVMMK
jgi:hypothetical protein